jgi:hypothetical protein
MQVLLRTQRIEVRKMSPNAHIWRDYGIDNAALMDELDRLMPSALELARTTVGTLLEIVTTEAGFQTSELPKRSDKFRAKNAWKKPVINQDPDEADYKYDEHD